SVPSPPPLNPLVKSPTSDPSVLLAPSVDRFLRGGLLVALLPTSPSFLLPPSLHHTTGAEERSLSSCRSCSNSSETDGGSEHEYLLFFSRGLLWGGRSIGPGILMPPVQRWLLSPPRKSACGGVFRDGSCSPTPVSAVSPPAFSGCCFSWTCG
ncbi:unnamed protein product, partial [Ectocarpus sp. 12 AP-2014]